MSRANKDTRKSATESTQRARAVSHSDDLEQIVRDRIDKALSEKMQLEAYIKNETRAATHSVYKFIGVMLGAFSLAGFLCWDKILDHVSTKAVAKVANDVATTQAREIIRTQVLGMISNSVPDMVGNVVPGMIKATVPDMIEQSVPEMIRRGVEDSERHLKDVAAEIDNEFANLEREEKSLAEKYQKAEAKLSFVPIMAEARMGNRISYEKLIHAINENPDLADFIVSAVSEVKAQYKEMKFNQYHYGVTLKKPGSVELKFNDYISIVNGDYEWNCNGAINDLVATGRKEFVATLVRAVRKSKRLDSVYLAIAGIEKLTNKSFPPIGIKEVLEWWETASATPEYHSPYEFYYDLQREYVNHNSLTETNKTVLCEYLSRFSKLQDEYPDCTVISEHVLPIVAYSRFRNDIICSTNDCFYKKALDVTRRTPFGKTDRWHCYKAFNDAFFGGLVEGINERLKTSPSFEQELKDSALFKKSFFDRTDIKWPSKAKGNSPVQVAKKPISRNLKPLKDLQSQGIGYVTVSLKPGKQPLSLPFVKDDGISKEKLGSKSDAAREGDVISWTIDLHTYNYTFSGGQWRDEEGNDANGVEIPVGQCDISYESISNEESEMAFSGVIFL